MAEHVRNELARAFLPVRPNRILTLAKFLEPFTPYADAPESLVHLLISQFEPKFPRALAAIMGRAADLPPDLARTASQVEDQLAIRGMAIREKRLRAAVPVTNEPIILDGFFTLSGAEMDFLERLAKQTQVTVTLPDWPGSEAARERLLLAGFHEQRFDAVLRAPRRSVVAALSLEQEVEQIARAILERAAQMGSFREMGVLLRVRDPYASALETTFARFGIPARFHFAGVLSAHPAIQYVSGIIRVLLNGWDHAELVTLLRMPVSGIGATPEGDRLDFEMRGQLPSCGPIPRFASLDPWRRERLLPEDWASRLKTLRGLIPPPETNHIGRDGANILRSTAAALEAFEDALDTTALGLDHNPVTLAEFWPSVDAAISVEKLRVPNRRRNVVNVLDIHEARQWELSVAFVCGLNERHFPQYHREDPLLPDPARLHQRQQEERFLFDLATTRATQETILSYARFNDKGDPQLRSFFLEEPGQPANPIRILPRPPLHPTPRVSELPAPDLRVLHAKLAPTSIESFLQCPFQFFARKTLKLRKRPEAPRDRLNVLVQGNILHKALAEGSLDRAFEEACAEHHVPRTYRREAVRLELLRHFEAFRGDTQWPFQWPKKIEQEFVMALTPELSVRGRIDRLDMSPDGQAIVIDYKYSAAAKIRERFDGEPVQGGLYLLAAERFFHLQPAGMFYCGLRQSVTWEGWHANLPGLQLGEARTASALRELITAAEATSIEVFESIAAGDREVRPADRNKCRYCDFNSICRVESTEQAAAAS
jgi:ATP-dependent helicase/DNAse subunit B